MFRNLLFTSYKLICVKTFRKHLLFHHQSLSMNCALLGHWIFFGLMHMYKYTFCTKLYFFPNHKNSNQKTLGALSSLAKIS